MKRTVVAVTLLAGLTIPALVATMFLFGCCVLPFHKTLHQLMPLCKIASEMWSGAKDEAAEETSVPAPTGKTSIALLRALVPASGFVKVVEPVRIVSTIRSDSPRSLVSLGALRCDDDVGLQILLVTFLI